MAVFSSPVRSPRTHRAEPLLTKSLPTSPHSSTSSAGATFGSTKTGELVPLRLGDVLGLDTTDNDIASPPSTLPSGREVLGDWPPMQEAAMVHGHIPSKQKFVQGEYQHDGLAIPINEYCIDPKVVISVKKSTDSCYKFGSDIGLTILAEAAETHASRSTASMNDATAVRSASPHVPTLEVDGFEEIPAPKANLKTADSWREPKKTVKQASIRKPTYLDWIRASPPPAIARALASLDEQDSLTSSAKADSSHLLVRSPITPHSVAPNSLTPGASMSTLLPPFEDNTPGEPLNSILSPPRHNGKRERPEKVIPDTPSSAHVQKKVKVESPDLTANTAILYQYVTTPKSSTIATLPIDDDGIMQVDGDHVDYEAQTAVGLCLTAMGDPVFQTFVVDDYQLPNTSTNPEPTQLRADLACGSVRTRGELKSVPPARALNSPSPAPRKPSSSGTYNLYTNLGQNNDIVMRSPSPTVSDLLRDRLTAEEKGKHRAVPAPGFSDYKDESFVMSSRLKHTSSLVNQHLSPNASAASIFPPPPPQSLDNPQYRTPARPASLVNRHRLFESSLNSRGPAISATLLAEHFPLRESLSPNPTLRPPSPYLEDGEIPDPIAGRSNLLDFVQQQAENAPAEHDDFLTYLPPPTGGFPRVHFSSPTGAFENIDDSQLLDWERLRCNGLVALGISFGGHGALDGDVDPRYRQLISYATHLLNARFHTDRIAIAQPRPKNRVSTLNSPPHTALLYGITVEEAAILEEEGVMCTPRLALFFHKLDVLFPSYVGAIHGLTTRVIEPVYDMVINHFMSPEAGKLFATLSSRQSNTMVAADHAQAYHLNTMYVRRLDCRAKGNTHAPVFLVYMRSPATDYHSYRLWTAFCKKMNLSHSLYGNGYLRSPGLCALCHGHDHPSGLCRFPTIEGWNAPAPYQVPNFSIPPPPSSNRDTARTPKPAGAKGQQKGKKRRNNAQTIPSTPR